jgi:hypothetical protein
VTKVSKDADLNGDEFLSLLRSSRVGEEPDPHDLMLVFPAERMRMWPISTRVNKTGRTMILRSSSPSNLASSAA